MLSSVLGSIDTSGLNCNCSHSPLVTNGLPHPYHLDFRGIRSIFSFLFHFLMKFMKVNRMIPKGTPRFSASRLGLFCLSMPPSLYEARCEKPRLRGLRPGPTKTRLYDHRRWLEASNRIDGNRERSLIFRKIVNDCQINRFLLPKRQSTNSN